MVQSSFQSHPDDKLYLHVSELPGSETPESRHTLEILAYNDQGEKVTLRLSLTVPQLAVIVKHFFWVCTVQSAWAAKVLERLLKKRWGICTNEVWKDGRGLPVQHAERSMDYWRACTQLDFTIDDQGRRVMRRVEASSGNPASILHSNNRFA